MSWEPISGLLCDVDNGCMEAVSMLDKDGYVYCARHGLERRTWQPCRKLRPYELRRLQRGEPVARY